MGQIFKTGKDRYDAFGHFGGQAYYYIEEYRLMKQVNLILGRISIKMVL